ncbi:MAG: hypothetical protein ACRDDZ_01395 [Marinifilaceae bacterium]
MLLRIDNLEYSATYLMDAIALVNTLKYVTDQEIITRFSIPQESKSHFLKIWKNILKDLK